MAKQIFLNNFDWTFFDAVKATPLTGTPATELGYGILQLGAAASAVLLPPTGGDWYILTAYKKSGSVESDYEIIKVLGVDEAGYVQAGECRIRVERAQEGTTAKAYIGGDYISMRLTKGGMTNVLQSSQNLADVASAATARTNLGLGSAAVSATTDFAASSHVGAGGTAHANATTSVAGFMSSADKTKLDGVATGATANTGTVTTVSVITGNGLAGTVANAGTTPAITLTTSVNGIAKGDGTSFSTAVDGTDYVSPTGTATLTNKTLTSPVISGGTINNASVGATTPSTGAFTTLSAVRGSAGQILSLSDGSQQSLNTSSDAGVGAAGNLTVNTANGGAYVIQIGGTERTRTNASGLSVSGGLSATGTASLATGSTVGATVTGGASSFTIKAAGGTNSDALFSSLGSGSVYLVTPSTGSVYANINGVNVGAFSSTGLSVSGTIQSGSGSGTSTGWVQGYYGSSGVAGMWTTAVTPSTSNFSFAASSTATLVNGASDVFIRVANSDIARATSTGLAVTGTNLALTTSTSAEIISARTGGRTVNLYADGSNAILACSTGALRIGATSSTVASNFTEYANISSTGLSVTGSVTASANAAAVYSTSTANIASAGTSGYYFGGANSTQDGSIRYDNVTRAMTFRTAAAGSDVVTLDASGILKLEQDQHIRNGKGLALYEATNSTYYSLYNSSGTLTFSNGTGRMFLDASGCWALGRTSASTVRSYIRGVGNNPTSHALIIENSTPTTTFSVRDDGFTAAPVVYGSFTTGSAANMYIDTNGGFYRSTSALKYKQDIRDLESIDISAFRPVRYKSKCSGDDPTKEFLGFIADEYVDTHPELVVFGANGEPEGFNYERMTVVLCKKVQEQQDQIESLLADKAQLLQVLASVDDRLAALESK